MAEKGHLYFMVASTPQPNPLPEKITRRRTVQIVKEKRPLNPDVFYTYTEISHSDSPHKVTSPAALYRALKAGKLKPKRGSGKPLLKGSDLIAWIEGRAEQ